MSPDTLIALAPLPALAGFLLLALLPFALPRAVVSWIGVLAGNGAAYVMIAVFATGGGHAAGPLLIDLGWTHAQIALSRDPSTVLAAAVSAVIGAMVMTYAGGYMDKERLLGHRRFFALMNLFLAGMLTFVLAADAVLLFLGWETIGLCSFFLIAHYTRSAKAVAAGRKALVMTRIADALLLAGLILLYLAAGSTRLDAMLAAAPGLPPWRLAAAAGLIAAGALGKSAQIPFQTWLPSAMTGPTPVSALLHSATMVGAGVILLARLAPLFAAAPAVSGVIAAVGLATALVGALAAVIQADVKRLLACSTISQIGFMMLALGVGAPAAALAHFTVHAAFKSLLFLSAGTLSRAADGSTAIEDLRGSMARRPIAFWSFAIGAASLAGLPFLTAGWFSKEAVLAAVWSGGPLGPVLWAGAAAAAALTGAYAFRVVFTGASPGRREAARLLHGPIMWAPLVALAIAALFGGFAVAPLIRFVGGVPGTPALPLLIVGASAPVLGAALAWALVSQPERLRALRKALRRVGIGRLDSLYYALATRNFRRATRALAGDDVGAARPLGDRVGRAPIRLARLLIATLVLPVRRDPIGVSWMRSARLMGAVSVHSRRVQTGRVRDYAAGVALGCIGLLLFAWGTAWR